MWIRVIEDWIKNYSIEFSFGQAYDGLNHSPGSKNIMDLLNLI